MSYDDGDRFLDGPRLCEWLESLDLFISQSAVRRMYEWRRGGLADVYTVDRYLCRWGMHLDDVPEDCWSERAPDKGKWARAQ